jgi:hypothetical protein
MWANDSSPILLALFSLHPNGPGQGPLHSVTCSLHPRMFGKCVAHYLLPLGSPQLPSIFTSVKLNKHRGGEKQVKFI